VKGSLGRERRMYIKGIKKKRERINKRKRKGKNKRIKKELFLYLQIVLSIYINFIIIG
jgi:hypothetical protein